MTYKWELLFLPRTPKTRPKLLHRLRDNQFVCENQEIWYYNLHKPVGQRWEYYDSFTYEQNPTQH